MLFVFLIFLLLAFWQFTLEAFCRKRGLKHGRAKLARGKLGYLAEWNDRLGSIDRTPPAILFFHPKLLGLWVKANRSFLETKE